MRYFFKKFISLIITLLLVSFLAFLTFQIIPGDPVTKLLGTEYTEEMAAQLRAQLGLDAPFFLRYVRWLGAFVTGDFGTSYSYSIPVASLLGDKLPVTGLLSALAFLLVVGISIPLGIWLASHEDSLMDKIFTALNQIAMSIRALFSGIMMTLVLGLTLKLFTPNHYISYTVDFGASLYYLLFPAVAIAIPKIAMTVKLLKSSIHAEYRRDYVRTAISRGSTRRRVLYTHVLRNAIIPVVTFLALTIPEIVAGSIIIEQVFTIPGLGRLLISSILNRDFPSGMRHCHVDCGARNPYEFFGGHALRVVDPRIRIDQEAAK